MPSSLLVSAKGSPAPADYKLPFISRVLFLSSFRDLCFEKLLMKKKVLIKRVKSLQLVSRCSARRRVRFFVAVRFNKIKRANVS